MEVKVKQKMYHRKVDFSIILRDRMTVTFDLKISPPVGHRQLVAGNVRNLSSDFEYRSGPTERQTDREQRLTPPCRPEHEKQRSRIGKTIKVGVRGSKVKS